MRKREGKLLRSIFLLKIDCQKNQGLSGILSLKHKNEHILKNKAPAMKGEIKYLPSNFCLSCVEGLQPVVMQ